MRWFLIAFLLPWLGLWAEESAPIGQPEAVDLDQLAHPVQPFLWEITGGELEKASYLFGTIHMSDERVVKLHPAAKTAYDDADTFAAEIDLSLANQLKMSQVFVRQDKKPLKSLIGEDLYDAVNVELKAINPGLDLKPFDTFQVWALAITLPMLEEQLKGKPALDPRLWEHAGRSGKELWALETIEQQLGGIKSLNLAEQQMWLSITVAQLKEAREEGVEVLGELRDAYLVGSADGLLAIIDTQRSEQKLSPQERALEEKFLKLMIDKRNEQMAQSIINKLEKNPSKSHFIAAGTLHFLGDQKIQKFLIEAGYTVTRITH